MRTDKNFAESAFNCTHEQAEFLLAKLSETDNVESKADNIKRDMCSKRTEFIEEMFKIKVEFNKTKVEIYKETFEESTDKLVKIDIENLDKKIIKVETETNRKVAILKKLDEEQQFYATSKTPIATPYPTPKFSGEANQNLVIWLGKMHAALQDNQIRKNKQVEVLRANLEGEAKKLVPDNVTDWTEAKQLLMDVYGDPKILWMSLYLSLIHI